LNTIQIGIFFICGSVQWALKQREQSLSLRVFMLTSIAVAVEPGWLATKAITFGAALNANRHFHYFH
jgi:hypothetical protein